MWPQFLPHHPRQEITSQTILPPAHNRQTCDCCPSSGMTRFCCDSCFKLSSSLRLVSSFSFSFSTLLCPSLSLSRLCWYSCSCSWSSCRSLCSLRSSRWHKSSLPSNANSVSLCWTCRTWHSRSHCWRSRTMALRRRTASASSSRRRSASLCRSCSCRAWLLRVMGTGREWGWGDGLDNSRRRSLWTS